MVCNGTVFIAGTALTYSMGSELYPAPGGVSSDGVPALAFATAGGTWC